MDCKPSAGKRDYVAARHKCQSDQRGTNIKYKPAAISAFCELRSVQNSPHMPTRRTRWRSWFRYCATNHTVVGSFPDVVIRVFHWHNLSGRNYGSGVDSACLTRVPGDRCVGLPKLPPSCADCHEIWELQPPGSLRVCPGLYRDCFTLFLNADTDFSEVSLFYENCEKRQFSSSLFVRSHARLQLGGFSWNFIFGDFFKKNPSSKFKFH